MSKIVAMLNIYFLSFVLTTNASIPLVINTWKFTNATNAAWDAIKQNENSNYFTAKDALVIGCSTCEREQCDKTVGYGGSPDERGETTLDALVFDGTAMDMGAVGGLRRIKNAISLAHDVLELTEHSMLVGDLATEFAKSLNYKEEDLSTGYSQDVWTKWKANNCQPNFWKNVLPDPKTSCGPYQPVTDNEVSSLMHVNKFSSQNHDTIGMIVIDKFGNIVAGTSTNGATHKVPGRVGDSPIPGAGAYADSDVGAAVATGDGDVMMRFLPSFLAVEEMRRGSSPTVAAKVAIDRIVRKYPKFFGGVVAVDRKGNYGAACNGMDTFPFSVVNNQLKVVTVKTVTCVNL